MSTTDNIHKKGLLTNALKTNLISNTQPKLKEHEKPSNTQQKVKEHEKRFSNISRQKQPLQEFRQTIHKNTSRYYEEMDMQGSATILPQKNSSRKNIYINQNTNTQTQLPSNQRKQFNFNNLKSKSPLDKNHIPKISTAIPLTAINNNISTSNLYPTPNIPLVPNFLNNKFQNNPINQTKIISHIKNINKNNQLLTDRDKSYHKDQPYRQHKQEPYRQPKQQIYKQPKQEPHRPPKQELYRQSKQQLYRQPKQELYRQPKQEPNRQPKQQPYRQQRDENPKDQKILKMKSLTMNNTKINSEIDDLMCDEQMEFIVVPQKQQSKKQLSCQFQNKNESKIKEDYQSEGHIQQNNKTQKKQPNQKQTMILQKTKSQHTISTKQVSSVGLLGCKNGQKSIPQLNTTIENSQNISLQQTTHKQQKYVSITVNYEEQLKKFNQLQNQFNMNAELQTIIRLQNRQKYYNVQPNYIELKQKNFNWFMRAVLMDWMMHVCFEFGLKRETYYIAVALADKYLEKTNDLPKSEFQLVGAASMFIAAKLEEFEALSSADFSKSTDNRYSAAQIKQTELKICKSMNYELNPPTLYMWANRFMVHWDNYIDMTNAKFHPYFQNHKPKYFKRESQQSYLLFREMMQFIDCSNLDVQTLQFAPKILVCSFMYLVLGKNYKEWPAKRIVEEFPRTSHYLVEQEEVSSFNHLFHMFLSESFELDIIQLLPAVQYCSTYFTLILNFDAPSYAMKNGEQDENQLNLEEYQSFQTYNGKMIDLIKKRYRGLYP